MKLICGPSDVNSLTLEGDFRCIGFLLDDLPKGQWMPAMANLVLQVSDQGTHTEQLDTLGVPNHGHWTWMLWNFAYSQDVVVLPTAKRRGSCLWVEHVEYPADPPNMGTSVFHTLFYEIEHEPS